MPNYRWGRNLRSAPGLVAIGPEMYEDIERFIEDNQHRVRRFNKGITALAQLLAEHTRGEAMNLSRGRMVLTRQGEYTKKWNPARTAFRIPVDVWTGEYYRSWKVRYIGVGTYQTYNDSGHAYWIEIGVNPRTNYAGFRRRPIMKMSVRNMLRQIRGTRTLERFTEGVFQTGSAQRVKVF